MRNSSLNLHVVYHADAIHLPASGTVDSRVNPFKIGISDSSFLISSSPSYSPSPLRFSSSF